MKNKIILSLFLAGIIGVTSVSAQVVEEKKEPIKKDAVTIERRMQRDQKDFKDRKDFRKGDFAKKGPYKRGEFKRTPQKGSFSQADKRKFEERRKFMAQHRANKNSKFVMLHKDCKDCMKLDKKFAKHQTKQHPRKSGAGK